jgi:endonuclease/exonuclease/phosphatase family metal-dependent hydrolase
MIALRHPRNFRRLFGVSALLFALLAMPMILPSARGNPPILTSNIPADAHISVMTYNVEGLPFPARIGRSSSLGQIGERLRELRAAGQQPHVVVLQEAFSDDAKRIGIDSGYRYIVRGPSADMAATAPLNDATRKLDASASMFKGEGIGKYLDSGLVILSDYPVVAVRRVVYQACAGFDCMANKGAVMALLAVPGLPTPVAVVDTHLNSRAASRVDFSRSLIAYRQQVETLGKFLRDNLSPTTPLIVAGDFNVGKDQNRVAYLRSNFAHWWNGSTGIDVADALHSCAAGQGGCDANMPADAYKTLRRGKDWQIAAPALASAMRPRAISVPFGRESDGTMLSDHMGYTVHYRWQSLGGRS